MIRTFAHMLCPEVWSYGRAGDIFLARWHGAEYILAVCLAALEVRFDYVESEK